MNSLNHNEEDYNVYQSQSQQTSGMRVVERGEKVKGNKFSLREHPAIIVLFIFAGLLIWALIVLVSASVKAFHAGETEEAWWNLFGCGFILLFLMIPGGIVLLSLRKNKGTAKLMEMGLMAKLPISEIIFTNSYMNHVPGYKIMVSNPDRLPGFLFNYQSKTIYSYDIEWLREGQLLPVYVDRTDPTKFYMDYEAAVSDARIKESEESYSNHDFGRF